MITYQPFELHCHTLHSDGQFTVPELAQAAKDYGFQAIALTDHNTSAGAREVTPQLQAQTVPIYVGIEWTTFFGHLLVLGCDRYVDWRFVTPDTIDEALQEIRAAGGTAGIAHPFEYGTPLMCGSHWDFKVTRWDLVDYIELWSQEDPMSRAKNQLCLKWWTEMLNAGYHLPISAGRDWHGADTEYKLISATYLGIEKNTYADMLSALRAGRSYITLGPTLEVMASQGKDIGGLGSTVHAGLDTTLHISVGTQQRYKVWAAGRIVPQMVRVTVNGKTLRDMPLHAAMLTLTDSLPEGWLRIELYGTIAARQNELLAITSPIYIV